MGVPVTSANSQWIVLGSCREAVDRRKWDSRVGWGVSFWAGGGHWAKPSLRHWGKVPLQCEKVKQNPGNIIRSESKHQELGDHRHRTMGM